MAILSFIYLITLASLALSLPFIGVYQVCSAIIRLIKSPRKDGTFAIGLKKYLALVILYLFGLLFSGHLIDEFALFYRLGLPLGFAIKYFQFIRRWNRASKNIQAYDQEKLLHAPCEDRLLLETFPKSKINLELKRRRLIHQKSMSPTI